MCCNARGRFTPQQGSRRQRVWSNDSDFQKNQRGKRSKEEHMHPALHLIANEMISACDYVVHMLPPWLAAAAQAAMSAWVISPIG